MNIFLRLKCIIYLFESARNENDVGEGFQKDADAWRKHWNKFLECKLQIYYFSYFQFYKFSIGSFREIPGRVTKDSFEGLPDEFPEIVFEGVIIRDPGETLGEFPEANNGAIPRGSSGDIPKGGISDAIPVRISKGVLNGFFRRD